MDDNQKTALFMASRMPLPSYATEAMRYGKHPQERTLAFHQFYGAPIRSQRPDRTFSHMNDQRAAFRASFILSEALEMLRDGLGVEVTSIRFKPVAGSALDFVDAGDGLAHVKDEALCTAIQAVMPGKRDLVGLVDALGDLNVVVNGFAIELGVDMRRVDQEICASNFTKADENGEPIIGNGENGPLGKVLKGPKYVEPRLAVTLGLGDE